MPAVEPLLEEHAVLASSPGAGAVVLAETVGETTNQNPAMQLVDPQFFCTKCGYTVVKSGVHVVRKSPLAFQCNKCNTKTTILHRMFCSLPPEDFHARPICRALSLGCSASTPSGIVNELP